MAIRSVNLSDTFGEFLTEFNLMGTDIGDLSLLTTSNTSSIVAAIASLDSDLRADIGAAITTTNIDADSATIANITFTNINGGNIDADSGTITAISFTNAYGGNINANSATINTITFTNINGGNIDADSAYFTGVVNAQDFNSTSDESLKENIETLNNAIDVVNRIRPVSFTWKKNNQIAYGVIAQEIEEVLPAIVDEDKNHIKRVAYSQLIPFLVQVIQQQDIEIQKIKNTLNLE
jgi:hypothetical protein